MSGPLFLDVLPDNRFNNAAERARQTQTGPGSGNSGSRVRRPVNGLVVHKNSYASLSVMTADKGAILLTDSGGSHVDAGTTVSKSSGYSNFLLQQVDDQRMEKQQIMETFGEPYIFLFGERARVMSFQGILLNTDNFNWEAEWWQNYEEYLRGTRCVENDARIFLTVDNVMIGGYMVSCTSSKNAQERAYATLSFQMFVTSYINLTNVGDPHVYPEDVRSSMDDAVKAQAKAWLSSQSGVWNSVLSGLSTVNRILDVAGDTISKIGSTVVKYEKSLGNLVSGPGTLSIGPALGIEGFLQSVSNPLLTPGNSSGTVEFQPDLLFSDLAYEYVQGNIPAAPVEVPDDWYSKATSTSDQVLSKFSEILTGTPLGRGLGTAVGVGWGLVAAPAMNKVAVTVDGKVQGAMSFLNQPVGTTITAILPDPAATPAAAKNAPATANPKVTSPAAQKSTISAKKAGRMSSDRPPRER